MRTIHQTFDKRWLSAQCTYICKCGHRFVRENRDWYTINPFNTESPSEIAASIRKKLFSRVRPCPKCKKEVKPQVNA